MEYDPYSYEIDEDPYPVYEYLRDHAPVYRNERLDFFALSRFDDCLAAFLDWKTFSSARGTVLELMDSPEIPPLMIFMDPPRQTRLRNLVRRSSRRAESPPSSRRSARCARTGSIRWWARSSATS